VTDPVQAVAIGVSVLLLGAVIELVRRRRLREEYAFAWLIGAVALVGLAVWRRSLDVAAQWLGVFYPPAVLLLAGILAGFVVLLFFSVVISRQRQQIEQLVEELALLECEVRALQSRTVASAQMVDSTADESAGTANHRNVG
jgi:hypothetical protein